MVYCVNLSVYGRILSFGKHRGIRLCSILALVALLAACAGGASGIGTSNLVSGQKVEFHQKQESEESPLLVAIRFPSLVDGKAADSFVSKYVRQMGGSATGVTPAHRQEALNAISKTAYFAQEFYMGLRPRLPKGAVMLAPYEIRQTRSGALIARDAHAVSLPPSVLTVEFVTVHEPDPDKIMSSRAVTFGDLVTPLFVIRSMPEASPKTGGLLAVSEPIIASASGAYGRMAKTDRVSFVQYLNRGPAVITGKGIQVRNRQPARINSVLRLPMEKIRIDLSTVQAGGGSNLPFAQAVRGYSDLIVALLNQLGGVQSLSGGLGQWASYYDKKDGVTAFASPTPAGLKVKHGILMDLYHGERSFVVEQSDFLLQASYKGEFGRKMRALLVEERDHLDERRRLATSQNINTGLSVGLAVLGGYRAYEGDTTTATLATTGALMANSFRASASQKSRALATNFRTSFQTAYRKRFKTTVEIAKNKRQLTFQELGQLRKQARGMYLSWANSPNQS